MKRWLFTGVLCLLSAWALAQGRIPLLDRVEGHRVHFHYTYSLSQKGGAFNPVTEGNVLLEGNAYILEGLDLKVVSDGHTRWTLDPQARECVVETVEKEDILTNPALFVASYKNHLDQIRVNAQGPDSLDVTLTLDADNKARFVLRDIVFEAEQGKSGFQLDGKSLAGYLVTDLR